ncbi:gluconeogenesis factor YvcK family protein [Thermoanaerobacterium butyriciformans]|uniref:Putative gluconeogenesis factor n=1 Tax=Thermoanaerobacterium butyriciformans TaxID=1702242 RepID=A0ABS4NHZ7_9THEO|nr:YvcK family protein [Thermoanaerobacterium butyriciformans]MBP2073286.1 putative cofD-like protein [Thermoanaerobacterium butyriciformans]
MKNFAYLNGPKVVVIGGGTGLSTMLRGLKKYTHNITAIVTVADDGGGSGVLREDLGMLPPGDIRNCILALANTEPTMEKLLQYRFTDGMLKGQSFGNLFLAAMNGISNSFEEAVKKMSEVLAVSGKVLPVTLDDVKLKAKLKNGIVIDGESLIPKLQMKEKSPIERIFLEPKDAKPVKEALIDIMDADEIILGPGSLYTSIIPNLLVNDVCEAIEDSKAIKVYVCNIMTQPGETIGYDANAHVDALFLHGLKSLDYVIVNNGEIPYEYKDRYKEDMSQPVKYDIYGLEQKGIKVIEKDVLAIRNNYIRHDEQKLAETLMELLI